MTAPMAEAREELGVSDWPPPGVEWFYSDEWVAIAHADAFDVLPSLSDLGAIITDPPYSSGGQFRGDRMAKTLTKYISSDSGNQHTLDNFVGDTRDQRGFFAWASMWLMACRASCVEGAPLCMFTDWRQLPVSTDAVQAGGWTWRGLATWWKPGIRMQSGRFSGSAEYVVYATNGAAVVHGGAPQNVISCAPVRDRRHIAEKPVEVMRWTLGVVPPRAVVLDPFMGSGTTLRAAKDLGFRAIGVDASESCCAIAAERMSQEVFDFSGATR